ncbi:unnamed protein product [Closterium sp. NIES-54]
MARKCKSQAGATEEALWRPKDLAYVKWMTTELAAGRSIARPLRKVGHTSSQSRVTPPPTAGPSTVDVNTDYDTNEDDADKDTDDDDEDAESEGVDPVAQWCGDAEYNGPAEEPALAPTVGRKRGGAKTRKMASAKGKAHAEESAHSEATVEASPGKGPGSEWSPKESTILVAAPWFTEDELTQMTWKQGSQYYLHLIEHIKL